MIASSHTHILSSYQNAFVILGDASIWFCTQHVIRYEWSDPDLHDIALYPLLSSRDGALLECTFQRYRRFPPRVHQTIHSQVSLATTVGCRSERREIVLYSRAEKRLALTVVEYDMYLRISAIRKDNDGNIYRQSSEPYDLLSSMHVYFPGSSFRFWSRAHRSKKLRSWWCQTRVPDISISTKVSPVW
jgi:hypothetical protein